MFERLALAAAALLVPQADVVPLDAQNRAWNAPVTPFEIADGLFYVGAADVTAYAFRTRAGVVLLDTGFRQTVPQVVANLRTLGMDVRDVRYILTSQAHYDHVGGVAEIRRLSGATLVVSAGDAAAMAGGGRGDFAFGDELTFPRAKPDRVIRDGGRVTLGGVTVRANLTPGHTRGCTTWSAEVRVGGRVRQAVFVCSLSVPGYRLADNSKYPAIIDDYRRSFARIANMPCDIFLGAHGAMFDLDRKRRALAAGDRAAFVDPAGCRTYAAASRAAFERELIRQQAR